MKLADIIGGRYRYDFDESWHHEKAPGKDADKFWYEFIPCRGRAIIYLKSFADKTMAAYIPSIGRANNIHRDMVAAGISPKIDRMDGEAVITFPISAMKLAGKIVGARQKRKLTDEQKERLVTMGRENLKKINRHT